jgi:hypothetical protein
MTSGCARSVFLAHDTGGKNKRSFVLHKLESLNQFEKMQPGQQRYDEKMDHNKYRRENLMQGILSLDN